MTDLAPGLLRITRDAAARRPGNRPWRVQPAGGAATGLCRMSGRPLRFGVVGAGRVFTRMHLACLRERPELTLVAVCDLEPRRAADDLRASQIHPEDLLLTDDLDELQSRCAGHRGRVHAERRARRAGGAVQWLKVQPCCAKSRCLGHSRRRAPSLPWRPPQRTGRSASTCPIGCTNCSPTGRAGGKPCQGGSELHDRGSAAVAAGHVLVRRRQQVGWRRAGRSRPACARHARCPVWPGEHETLSRSRAPEERAMLDLDYEQATATVTIDRASRRVRFTVDVHIENGPRLSLDLRHGRLSSGDDVITAAESQPALAAIRGFLAAAVGARGGVIVDAGAGTGGGGTHRAGAGCGRGRTGL